MNRVQTVNQNITESKTRSKNQAVAGTPRCALARPGARMAAYWRSYRGRVPAVSWPGTDHIVGAWRRIVGAVSVVSWAQALCRSALCCAPGCRVLGCLTIQPSLKPSSGHNTLRCIVIQKLSSLSSLCHNTAGILQYNIPTAHLSCNTLPLLQYSLPTYLQYNLAFLLQ